MKLKRLLRSTAAVAIGAVVLYFVVRTLRASAGELRGSRFDFEFWLVIASFAVLAASNLLLPWAWKIICGFFGVQLRYADSLQIQFLSYITRLVPGRVLTLLSQVAVAKEKQIPPLISVATAVIFQVFGTIVGVQIFLLSVLLWPGLGGAVTAVCVVIWCLLFALSLWSGAIEAVVAAIMKRIKGQAVAFRMSRKNALAIQAILLASWAIYALALHVLMNSFGEFTFAQSGIITGSQAASSLIGYYTFISPGGLGVREGAQMALLGRHVIPSLAVLIPIVLRVWMTLGDIMLFLVGVIIRRRMANR
jgi:hypothetical protein